MRKLPILSAVNNWHTKQLDFAPAFAQAPVQRDICMKIPKGFDIEDGNKDDCTLQFHQNICGQKQTGLVVMRAPRLKHDWRIPVVFESHMIIHV